MTEVTLDVDTIEKNKQYRKDRRVAYVFCIVCKKQPKKPKQNKQTNKNPTG